MKTTHPPMETPAAAPVLVASQLAGRHADAVARFVESLPGWQRADDGHIRPDLVLVDADSDEVGGGAAVVLLTTPTESPAETARAAVRLGAVAVLDWPGERDRLAMVGAEVVRGATDSADTAEIRVAGASGGVGTTTVALALGGLAAWRGSRVLVLAAGAVPADPSAVVDPDDLSGPAVWGAATPVAGVPGLRLIRVSAPPRDVPVDPGPADLLVRDLGVHPEADTVVVRRDASGLRVLEQGIWGLAVLVGAGVVPRSAFAAVTAGRRVLDLPWSVRVARAGSAGRVPSALPGAWLRRLVPAVPVPRLVGGRG